MTQTITIPIASAPSNPLAPETTTRLTRALLACGVIAGPLYVVVGLIQILTRPGFDIRIHDLSLLSNGDLGWIQTANFVLCGLLVVAGAAGMWRALHPGPGGTWGPLLVGVYGLGLIGAGVLSADPAYGFPPGTPTSATASISWHGLLHSITSGVGLLALISACFAFARRFAAVRQWGWAAHSAATGVVLFAAFVGTGTASGQVWSNLAFYVAEVLSWTWLSAVALHLMSDTKPLDVGRVWWFWFTTNAFGIDKRLRRIFRMLPHDPRCKFCNAPFQGVGAIIVRAVFGKQRSALNPRFCNLCEEASRQFPGGAEVEMSMLFADVRGSTALSEKMTPTDFSRLINRFYTGSTKVIGEEDGLVEKLAGDAVAAFWGAGFAGPTYVRRTIQVAQNLLRIMSRQEIPVGIGVHSGLAYFGAMGTADGLTDISALGDEVNTAARLASKAAAGEIIVSEQALKEAGIDGTGLESRSLELKGINEPVPVRVMRI